MVVAGRPLRCALLLLAYASMSVQNAHALAGLTSGAEVASSVPAVETRVVLLVRPAPLDSELAWARERVEELGLRISTRAVEATELGSSTALAREAAREEPTLAVVWLSEWKGAHALFLYDAKTNRTLVRPLSLADGTAVTREEAAIILTSVLTALLEGAEPPLAEVAPVPLSEPASEVTPAEPLPPEETPPEPRDAGPSREEFSSSMVLLRLGYAGVEQIADSGSWQSGVVLGVRGLLTPNFYGDAGYAIMPSEALTIGGTTVALAHHPALFALGGQLPLTRRTRAEAALLLSVDRIVRTTQAAGNGLAPTDGEGRWLLGLGPRLGMSLELGPKVNLFGSLAVDFALTPYAYRVEQEAAAFAEAQPFRFRVELGGALSLL